MAGLINADRDVHRLTAAFVLGKEEREATDEERRKAKAVNFGLPGGMKPKRLQAYALNYRVCLTYEEAIQWREGWFDIYPEMRTFLHDEREEIWWRAAHGTGLTPAGYHEALSRPWFGDPDQGRQPVPWLGAMLLKVLREEFPAPLGDGRPYGVEELNYFWTQAQVLAPHLKKRLRIDLQRCRPSYTLYRAACDFFDRAPVFTLTGRLRAGAGYCARHYTVFQGLASCGAKLALWRLWRDPFLRQQGCRQVTFVHDEVLHEVPATADLVGIAARVKEVMVEEMRRVVPDVKVKVKMSYCHRWGSDSADMIAVPGVK
jgi:hypothetical protein